MSTQIPVYERNNIFSSMIQLTSNLNAHSIVVYFSLSCIAEGNGNPCQCSCLENPRDGGAWWAAVYGISKSQTRLKWLSSSSIVLVLPYINMSPPRVYTCSQSWTRLPPPSPYHPSGSSQCTSPKHPVSCIKPRLAIRFLYDIIHVSKPFSQIIPPFSSPTESKNLFYTSVSLLLSCI